MKNTLFGFLVVSILLTACASTATTQPAPPQEGFSPRTLYDLGGLESLKTNFNEYSGVTRLILLMSPT
ncbi:MAG: hypothetical protein DCC56_01625 [Anaerolineae bacterium]|nr:MAG: hypothetical protein DCC56_01625 [Anaerolineae bacterium]WKZ44736.1 MAG: hypothetical protein QY302_02970 [Anaerolineales bacterium]